MVDAYVNRCIQSIRIGLANLRYLHEGVVIAFISVEKERILVIENVILLVQGIGVECFEVVDKILLKVKLTNVRDGTTYDGVVREEFGVMMNQS